eukprot:TRINITY_DN2166_c0_g1_i1.p2 TRINITY_DN2166_c0_g1~~TRINITY_DN2166_c0_g1_i1.p2  ORF type:complete len:114 (-),score=34.02 TRINITY_DN2166_c0_g1_i1:263-604(-)
MKVTWGDGFCGGSDESTEVSESDMSFKDWTFDRLCESDSVVADMRLKGKASKAKTMSLCDCEDLCRAEDGGWGISFKLNERKPKKSKCFCHTKRPKKVKSKKGKGYQYINFDE